MKEAHCLVLPSILNYLVSILNLTMMHLDIACNIQIVNQFMGNPHKPHLSAVQRILRYLRGTPHRLFYSASPLNLCAYADADWARCPGTHKSTIGWCMILGTSPVSWKCKKANCL